MVVGLVVVTCIQVPNARGFVVGRERLGQLRHTLVRGSGRCSTPTFQLFQNRWNQGSDLEGSDRLKACIPYLLPLLDGDHFGQYLLERIPPLEVVHDILLGGLVNLWQIFPFAGLVFFIALTLGTRGNLDMNRNVRFSAQQAALIDVSLFVPELIASSFEGEDLPRQLLEPCSNLIYYYIVFTVAYCVYQNLQGKKPDQIPFISNWSEVMVGPF